MKRTRMRPSNRIDPTDEVQRILKTYSVPARQVFRMHVAKLLHDPSYRPPGRLGGVERDVRKVQMMLSEHPEAEAKRATIRHLLGLSEVP